MKKVAITLSVLTLALVFYWSVPRAEPLARNDSGQATRAAESSSPTKAAVAARIAAVENGLLPPVVIKGRPTPGMKLTDRMQFFKVPGVSIAVINHGGIEWARGYGFADVASKRPVTPKTRFQAASISKSVAATAALHFVEVGKISLDRDVNAYLKSWKVPDNKFTENQNVTLRRILSHSAGLTVTGFPGYAPGLPLPTLIEVLNGVKPANTAPIRVDYVPGTKWRYSGGGYTVMQQMLIDVLGKAFPTIMERTVLGPFGMKDSAYSQPLRADWQRNAATGYRPSGNPVRGLYHTYPELAAAGLWTTPSDLDRFAIGIQQALAGKSNPVISLKMTQQMLTRQIDGDGLGVFVDGSGQDLRFSHNGANEGFRCLLVAYATTGQGAAIMTNSDRGAELATEIMFAIAKAYGWSGYAPKQRAAVKVDPGVFKDDVGRYTLRPGFVITISSRDGRLFVHPKKKSRRL